MCDSSFDETQFLSDLPSNSDSDSEYDLSDPEAEHHSSPDFTVSSEHSDDDGDVESHSPGEDSDVQFRGISPDVDHSSSDSSDVATVDHSHVREGRARVRARGCARGHARNRARNRARDRARGRAKRTGRNQRDQVQPLQVHDISSKDTMLPKKHDFKPLRSVGPHLHPHAVTYSPVALFKLYFDSDIV